MRFFFLQMLGSRLEELMNQDANQQTNIVSMMTDESKQRQLVQEDEEEDFLDEGNAGILGIAVMKLQSHIILITVYRNSHGYDSS